MGKHPLYVSWTIRSGRDSSVTYLLELVEEAHGSSRTSWELEREVVLLPDGRIRSKSPTPRDPDPSAEMRPDPIEAIERGEMTKILPTEFERYWQMPLSRRRGALRRLLDRARH
jgi:hypothetical protein